MTDVLENLMSGENCKRLSYMLTWSNEQTGRYWVPPLTFTQTQFCTHACSTFASDHTLARSLTKMPLHYTFRCPCHTSKQPLVLSNSPRTPGLCLPAITGHIPPTYAYKKIVKLPSTGPYAKQNLSSTATPGNLCVCRSLTFPAHVLNITL